jgi:transcriptional regulator with GAF, ATPase, and Fis domain
MPQQPTRRATSRFAEEVRSFKRRLIVETLATHKGCVTKAAKDLGMNRQHLSTLMTRFKVRPGRASVLWGVSDRARMFARMGR